MAESDFFMQYLTLNIISLHIKAHIEHQRVHPLAANNQYGQLLNQPLHIYVEQIDSFDDPRFMPVRVEARLLIHQKYAYLYNTV